MPTENEDFLIAQQEAVSRMREMSRKANIKGNTHTMPPSPSFLKVGGVHSNDTLSKEKSEEVNREREDETAKSLIDNFLSGDIGGGIDSLLDKFKSDSDMLLILGLLLILYSEKSDKMLLLALLYILM